MSKNEIIKGTLILTLASLATKVLGFYNRIFLTRLIGVKELGIFQLIFPIYMLSFAVSCQGFSVALTKIVSYFNGKNQKGDAKRVLKITMFITFILSILTSIIFYYCSDIISLNILNNSNCGILLRILSIAIPFVSIKSCINAYFMGLKKPGYQGITVFSEQFFRIIATYFLAIYLSKMYINASLATIAIVLGEIISCLLAVVLLFTESKEKKIFPKTKKRTCIRLIIKDSFPLTINKTSITLLSSFEAIIMPSMLLKYYHDVNVCLSIYGVLAGIVIPFILFPATISTAMSNMLLPTISYAHARADNKTIKKATNNSLIFCIILGSCSCIGFLILGDFLGVYIFKSSLAGNLLTQMAYLCPLIYIENTMTAVLNGLGNVTKNLVFHLIAISIRITFNMMLVPRIGIKGFVLGLTISYVIHTCLLLYSLYCRKSIKQKNNLKNIN